jgi:type I restriction enzyme S subunit
MMFSVKVTSELEARLDPEFYSPTALETVRRIKERGAWMRLGEAMHEGYRVVYHGIDAIGGLDKSETVAFLAPTDVDSTGGFTLSQTSRVPRSYITDYPKGVAQPGELLIEVKGNVQKLALVPAQIDEAFLVSGSFFKALLLERFDSGYVFAFLIGNFGKILKERLCSNSIIDYIARADLESIPFPDLDLRAQHFLGDKVRQAEKLREHARTLDGNTWDKFTFLTANLMPPKKAWWATQADVDPYRINAPHYDAVVLDMLDKARASGGLVSLRSLVGPRDIAGGATPLGADYPPEGVFFVRVQNVKPYRLDLSDAAYIGAATDGELRRSRCAEGDVILSITGYPGTASLVMADDLPVNINQHSVRFEITGELTSEFVTAALNSPFLKKQVDRLAIGGTREALDYKSVGNLQIPVLSEPDRKNITAWVSTSNRCVRASTRLTSAAKLLVEALIEDKVTEAEFVTAQEALERGDNSADRALLQRVKRGGLDVPGQPPLFPDLDAFYALLNQTKTEDNNNL